MRWLMLSYMMLVNAVSWAQRQRAYTIKPGEHIRTIMPVTEMYRYADFLPGILLFKDGTSTTGRGLYFEC